MRRMNMPVMLFRSLRYAMKASKMTQRSLIKDVIPHASRNLLNLAAHPEPRPEAPSHSDSALLASDARAPKCLPVPPCMRP